MRREPVLQGVEAFVFVIADGVEYPNRPGEALVDWQAAIAYEERPPAPPDGEADFVDEVEVEVGDIGDDEGRVVDFLQDRRDELQPRNVIRLPRLVPDGQRQRINLPHGTHNARGKADVA